ncbi:MAG: hypothetical protein RLZZ245_75 [Verrucomicrobiota bacterium]
MRDSRASSSSAASIDLRIIPIISGVRLACAGFFLRSGGQFGFAMSVIFSSGKLEVLLRN